MAFPSSGGYARASHTPSSDVAGWTGLIDLSKLPADWWSNAASDPSLIRVHDDATGDEVPFDVIEFDPVNREGLLRFGWYYKGGSIGGTWSSGGNTVRIYYPTSGRTSYSASDTFGQHNAYDADWVQYLPLEGDADDRTGNNNDGSLSGISFGSNAIAGQVGQGVEIPSQSDHVNCGSAASSAIDGLENLTAISWLNPPSSPDFGEEVFFQKWDGGPGSLQMRVDDSDFQSRVHDGSNKIITDSGAFSRGSWNHMVYRLDGSNIKHFANGDTNLSSTSIGSISTNSDDADWGGNTPFSDGLAENGGLDELQLHAVGRSDPWILEEYGQSNDQDSYWNLGGGTWTFVADSGAVSLAATAAAQSGASAALAETTGLSGTAAGQSGASGILAITREVSATVAAQSGASAGLGVLRSLSATAAASSGASAGLRMTKALGATVAGQSGGSASLSIPGSAEQLAATVAGQSGASASLRVSKALGATGAGQSGGSATVTRIRGMAGTVAAASSGSGAIDVARGLGATVGATSDADAAMGVLRGLGGTATATSGADARLGDAGDAPGPPICFDALAAPSLDYKVQAAPALEYDAEVGC